MAAGDNSCLRWSRVHDSDVSAQLQQLILIFSARAHTILRGVGTIIAFALLSHRYPTCMIEVSDV